MRPTSPSRPAGTLPGLSNTPTLTMAPRPLFRADILATTRHHGFQPPLLVRARSLSGGTWTLTLAMCWRAVEAPLTLSGNATYLPIFRLIREVCTFYSIGRCPNNRWPSVVDGCIDGLLAPCRNVPHRHLKWPVPERRIEEIECKHPFNFSKSKAALGRAISSAWIPVNYVSRYKLPR